MYLIFYLLWRASGQLGIRRLSSANRAAASEADDDHDELHLGAAAGTGREPTAYDDPDERLAGVGAWNASARLIMPPPPPWSQSAHARHRMSARRRRGSGVVAGGGGIELA